MVNIKKLITTTRIGLEFEVFVPFKAIGIHHEKIPPKRVKLQELLDSGKINKPHDLQQYFYFSVHAINKLEQAFLAWNDKHKFENNLLFKDFILHAYGSTKAFIDQFDLRNIAIHGFDLPDLVHVQNHKHTVMSYAHQRIADLFKQQEGITLEVKNYSDNAFWVITEDASISKECPSDDGPPDGIGVEIITPPQTFEDAVASIDKVFEFFKRNGFETIESTGLHVNVSCASINKLDKLALILFLDENYSLSLFDRQRNPYCSSHLEDSFIAAKCACRKKGIHLKDSLAIPETSYEKLSETVLSIKNRSINFSKLSNDYLEFRFLGNENYHLDFNKVLITVKHIVHSLHNSILVNEGTKKVKLKQAVKKKWYSWLSEIVQKEKDMYNKNHTSLLY